MIDLRGARDYGYTIESILFRMLKVVNAINGKDNWFSKNFAMDIDGMANCFVSICFSIALEILIGYPIILLNFV